MTFSSSCRLTTGRFLARLQLNVAMCLTRMPFAPASTYPLIALYVALACCTFADLVKVLALERRVAAKCTCFALWTQKANWVQQPVATAYLVVLFPIIIGEPFEDPEIAVPASPTPKVWSVGLEFNHPFFVLLHLFVRHIVPKPNEIEL